MHQPMSRLALAFLCVGVVPAAIAGELQLWQPDGPWQLDQQPNQCSLLRRFKSGDDELLMQVQPNLYSLTHQFKLASATLFADARNGMVDLVIGDPKQADESYATVEVTADGSQRVLHWSTGDGLQFADIVDDDQSVRVTAPTAGTNALMQWSGAKKAFTALRACEDQIAAGKGEDAAARRAYKRQLAPSGNPGRWATNDDYQRIMGRRKIDGITEFRLTIDETGNVTDCEITQSSGFAILDDNTCKLIVARAQFTPALDAAGKPVGGTYSNRIHWQPPR